MDLDDDVYDEQLLKSLTTIKERWYDKEIAKLKEVVKEVMGEQVGSMPGGKYALFEIVAEKLNTHGFNRTAFACQDKWKRIKPVTGKHLQTNTSYDTLREVNNSEHDETFEVESNDATWGRPKGSKRKAVQGKPVSQKNVSGGSRWSREEELIFFNHIKARREEGEILRLKTVMTEEFFNSMVTLLKKKGYTRTLEACRNRWNVKKKEYMEKEESPENSSITVTPDTTFSTPHPTSDSRSDDDAVDDIMAADEGIASRVKYRSAIHLSESDTLPNREESANDIESLGAQVSSEIFLEEAFLKKNYLTAETLKELRRTTNLASSKIRSWFSTKRSAVSDEKKRVQDSSTSMALLNETGQGNSWTPKHSRTSDIFNMNEPLGYERASSDPRPSKKARYSNGGELSTDGQGDTTDMNLNIGDKSTPLSNPTVVTATDSRQHSVEAQLSVLPYPEEQIPTGYSLNAIEVLAAERREFQRRLIWEERKEKRLNQEIADHTAKIETEKLAKAQKEMELEKARTNRMAHLKELETLDERFRHLENIF